MRTFALKERGNSSETDGETFFAKKFMVYPHGQGKRGI